MEVVRLRDLDEHVPHASGEGQQLGIDNAGQIIVWSETAREVDIKHAFLWQGGTMRDLGTLPGWRNSCAGAINEHGVVLGWTSTGWTSEPCPAEWAKRPVEGEKRGSRAFVWENGVMHDLGTLGGAHSFGFAIDEAGQVVGQSQVRNGRWRAFVWESGIMTALPALGGKFSAALAINDAGQIVGWSMTRKGVKHAVLWTLKLDG